MLELIVQGDCSPMFNISRYNGIWTYATEILPTGRGAQYPMLCPRLRDFLARCMAADVARRPNLAEMVVVATEETNRGPLTYAPYDARETDEAIEGVSRLLVFDAHTAASGQEALRPGPRNVRPGVPVPFRIWAFP